MTIDELNALTTLTAADEVPVWDSEESGEPTKKITASNLAASVKSLGSLIGTGDLDSTPTQGSNKAVTSGGTYTAIQQSTASCVQTTYTNYTLAANARTYVYPTAPTVSQGHSAYLVAAQLSVNSNGVIFQGVNSSSRSALFYNTLSSALSGSDFPLYCTWIILPTA